MNEHNSCYWNASNAFIV